MRRGGWTADGSPFGIIESVPKRKVVYGGNIILGFTSSLVAGLLAISEYFRIYG